MKPTRDQIRADLIRLLRQLHDDHDEDEVITDEMGLLDDLNWQSVELIVLANALQEHYRQVFPFTEFLADLGERGLNDITVGQWVDFIRENLEANSAN